VKKNLFNKIRQNTETLQTFLNVTIADNGIFAAVKGGPTKAAADGYHLITEPLQKGDYTVDYKSSLNCTDEGCLETNFAQDIKYTIIAE